MSKKCVAYSESKLGLESTDNRKAFYAGWDAAMREVEKLHAEIHQLTHQLYEYRASFMRARDRKWVGLTDDEVDSFVWNMPYEPGQAEIRAIEAKLKEKNRG